MRDVDWGKLISSMHDECGVGVVANIYGERSHDIVISGVKAVSNLTHRGAVSADAKTGDGAGLLLRIPYEFFAKVFDPSLKRGNFAVGVIFFPQDDKMKNICKDIIENVIHSRGFEILGWRNVPINPEFLGESARQTLPDIQQIIIEVKDDSKETERKLYITRKQIEHIFYEKELEDKCYIASFSSRTIVYKGLLIAPQLMNFYSDLADPDFISDFAIFHQRYSTNTLPNWFIAQPFRMLAHNGEINTLQGNYNWMKARESVLSREVWGDDVEYLKPIVWPYGSDSSQLDNVLEFLVMSGRDLMHSIMILVPEAYKSDPFMDKEVKAFFQYNALISEPWDGPAALVMSDGEYIVATLDRNGLRPSRYILLDDGLFVLGSEVGMVEIDESKVIEKGRLGPGQILAVDINRKTLLKNDEIKRIYAKKHDYSEWIKNIITVKVNDEAGLDGYRKFFEGEELIRQQRAFGYDAGEKEKMISEMIKTGKEPVGAMGDDTPLPLLSTKPRNIFSYFRQRFAQVTNPPIDPYREKLVMSLDTYVGPKGDILVDKPENAKVIKFTSPVITDLEVEYLKNLNDGYFKSVVISTLYKPDKDGVNMEEVLEEIIEKGVEAVRQGHNIIILSDKGVNYENAFVPMLLVASGLHHRLIREGLRNNCSIIAETGEARVDHHFALLIGYGVSLINPYLAYDVVADMIESGSSTDSEISSIDISTGIQNYKKSIEAGLYKIMSKMGISDINSYRGAQIFEAIGISNKMISQYFTGTISKIEGIDVEDLARDYYEFYTMGYGNNYVPRVTDFGHFKFIKDGEYHEFNPNMLKNLQKAVRENDWEAYKAFSKEVNMKQPYFIKDLLEIKSDRDPISIDEVESEYDIVKRFTTQAMSLGALSPEAHETITIAMNRLGAKSNSGEGGEFEERYWTEKSNAIKQVASGRFGVTPAYLVSAQELEIKIAQGAKPGEGGQLPGIKVNDYIAKARYTKPGVTLISPPPHHDIYSIEDIAQLIYDLKHINVGGRVCVKLVSETGIGIVASGVAKGYSDTVQVSGASGGTGASPWGSIKYAGMPTELGLVEVQKMLVQNNLRGKVKLRVDSGLKTGKDVVLFALLGADEYGFGTIAMIAEGCIMARICHTNKCPVGVATQDPELRKRFPGKPEWVMNYMLFVAREVREILASMGYRSLGEIIGRVDLLKVKENVFYPKTNNIELSVILEDPDPTGKLPKKNILERNEIPESKHLDDEVLNLPEFKQILETGYGKLSLELNIKNTDRTVGAKISNAIVNKFRNNKGLPDGSINITYYGSAGQSFGAFLVDGITLTLIGDANDYVGKGIHGGRIILKPSEKSKFDPSSNVIAGNTLLYGATGGEVYIRGVVGERFAVRNSGAFAVVEGVGDHALEYMTGGCVVILGKFGKNLGAGMSNGIAFVLDEDNKLEKLYNDQMILIKRLTPEDPDLSILKNAVEKHLIYTGSDVAKKILDNFEGYLYKFWKIVPKEAEEKKYSKEEKLKTVDLSKK